MTPECRARAQLCSSCTVVAGVVALFLWCAGSRLRYAFKPISADVLCNRAFLNFAETKLSVFQEGAGREAEARQVRAASQPIQNALAVDLFDDECLPTLMNVFQRRRAPS